MTVQQWATAAADNNSSPPTGAPENMSAAAVNNTMREMMASIVIEAQVNRVKVVNSVAGTNTITGSLTPALTAYSASMIVVFTPANTNTGATTLNIDSLGALDVQKFNGSALVAGDLVAGIPAVLVLDTGADDWILLNPLSGGFAQLALSNVFTGATQIIQNASIPSLILDDTDAGTNKRRIAVKNNGGSFAVTGQTDAGVNTADAITATWDGSAFTLINLQATAVQVNGTALPDAANIADTSGAETFNGVVTATSFVATAAAPLSMAGGLGILSGNGSPEGVKSAPVGSLYFRSDGGAGSTLYVKESGASNTGWVAK